MKIWNSTWEIEENAYLDKYSTLQQGTHKIGF